MLRAAVQFGVSGSLISARGGDSAGDAVAAEAKRAGIEDLSSTFLDRNTASYTALLDMHGDVAAALADMAIYETALPRIITRRMSRDAIAGANALLVDANMPEAAIRKIVAQAAGKPVFALAISPAKAVRRQSGADARQWKIDDDNPACSRADCRRDRRGRRAVRRLRGSAHERKNVW